MVGTALLTSCAGAPGAARPVTLDSSFADLIDPLAIAILNDAGAVAFLQFEGSHEPEEGASDRFGGFFPDGLAARLKQQYGEIEVVERDALQSILEERGYNYVGTLDEEKIDNLGEFTAARFILTGGYTLLSSTVEVTVRLVDTRDATVSYSGVSRIYLSDDVRELLGLPPAPGSAAAIAAEVHEDVEGAMPEAEFRPILESIANAAFDDDKPAIIVRAFRGATITASQAQRVVRLLGFDDSRIVAIKTLYPLLADRQSAYLLLGELSFDSSVDEASAFMDEFDAGVAE